MVREQEREVRDVLDRLILRVERSTIRERSQQTRPRAPWRCPAGCKLDDLSCARLRFRQQCVPWRPSIQKQQRQLWDQEHLTQGDFVSELGNRYHSKMQCHLHAVEDQRAQAWRPSFEISDSEVDEIQQAFISSWDGKVEPLVWLKQWLKDGAVATGWGDEYRGPPPSSGHPIALGPITTRSVLALAHASAALGAVVASE